MAAHPQAQPPAQILARRLAVLFAAFAVVVTVLLILAIYSLLHQRTFLISPAVSPQPAPSTSARPATDGSSPASREGTGSVGAGTGSTSARGGALPGTGYPPGEPPGDIEDDRARASQSPVVSVPQPPPVVLPSVPSQGHLVPTPVPSALPGIH